VNLPVMVNGLRGARPLKNLFPVFRYANVRRPTRAELIAAVKDDLARRQPVTAERSHRGAEGQNHDCTTRRSVSITLRFSRAVSN